MATRFENVVAKHVGTTPTVIYTVPEGEKAILIGCNIANVTNAIVPYSLSLRKEDIDAFIVKNIRVANGKNEELMKGNKLVLTPGDSLIVEAALDGSADVIASLLVGVA